VERKKGEKGKKYPFYLCLPRRVGMFGVYLRRGKRKMKWFGVLAFTYSLDKGEKGKERVG